MAKRKSKDLTSTIITVAIIILALLSLCTMFMPIINQVTVKTGIDTFTATGADVFTAAFASKATTEMSAGAIALYGLKAAEDTAFVATIFMWGYMLTLLMSAVAIVFAVLSLLGLKFKLFNKIFGIALIVLAVVAFIFALIVAGKFTATNESIIGTTGLKGSCLIGVYFMFAGLIAGILQFMQARK